MKYMKQQLGVGFIPFEINDKIIFNHSPVVVTIEDIRMIQYIKEKKIEFEVKVKGMKRWWPATMIKKRIIESLVHFCKECQKEKVHEEGMICSKCEFAREQ